MAPLLLTLMACGGADLVAAQLPAPPAGAVVSLIAVDPLVAGLPARLRVRHEGAAAGVTVRAIANEGTRGPGPCGPAGGLCVDLVGPLTVSEEAVTLGADGALTLELMVPATPRVGLQAVAYKGRMAIKTPAMVADTLPDADRDADGLTDVAEVAYGTDLWTPDSDGDGFSDGDEVAAGSDPTDPTIRPAEVCDNGRDDDADGLMDCEDADCAGHPSCAETACADAVDNDADGLTDCTDEDCWGTGCAWSATTVRGGTVRYERRAQAFGGSLSMYRTVTSYGQMGIAYRGQAAHRRSDVSWRFSSMSGSVYGATHGGQAFGPCDWHVPYLKLQPYKFSVTFSSYGIQTRQLEYAYQNLMRYPDRQVAVAGCPPLRAGQLIPGGVRRHADADKLERGRDAARWSVRPSYFFTRHRWDEWVRGTPGPGYSLHQTHPNGWSIHDVRTWNNVYTPQPAWWGLPP